MIGFAGEGGGSGHRNFLPGVLAGEGATPAGSGLGNGLAEKEYAGVFFPEKASPEREPSPCGAGGGVGCGGFDWSPAPTASLLTTDTPLLQHCPIVDA